VDQVRSILTHPSKLLRKRSREVEAFTPEVGRLIEQMANAVQSANGSGLAAIQIGVAKRVIVLNCIGGRIVSFVNPRIVKAEGSIDSEESCLSLPGRTVRLKRYARVVVEHLRQHGQETLDAKDAEVAVALQHEIDHLNGVLIVDRQHWRALGAN
jgi:peptide deformylase